MASLAIEGSVDIDRIIAVLNVPPPSKAAESMFWEDYLDCKGDIPSARYRPFAAQLLSKRLRALVDPWLKTGLGDDGCERPLHRKLGPAAEHAVSQYSQEFPPNVYFDPGRGWAVSLGSRHGRPSGIGSLSPATDAEVQHLFFVLIACDLGCRLSKCRYRRCNRYFALQNPRKKYRSGTFCCPEHQKYAKAAECMKRKRDLAKTTLVDLAAAKLHQLKAGVDWNSEPKLKLKVRDYLRLAARKDRLLWDYKRLALHWITRNRYLIEARRSA